jgi:hypothetical protein
VHLLKGELAMERLAGLAMKVRMDRIQTELQRLKDTVDLLQIERDRQEVARW